MSESSSTYERMARAIRYIDAHFDERPPLAAMARAAGLSTFHFSREFRRWTGLSPTQYVKRLALDAAKRDLDARGSVLSAALAGGLSGPGRLHDLFVTFEAVSPGEYKAGGAGVTLRYGVADTPFGAALVASTERGLAYLGFIDGSEGRAVRDLERRWPHARLERDDRLAASVARQLFRERSGPVTLAVRGTNFQVQVWRALLELGRNRTLTYGELAAAIGRPRASRAVGSAVGENPVAWLIPCHHVLRGDGGLGGYRWGLDRKRAILAWEYAQAGA